MENEKHNFTNIGLNARIKESGLEAVIFPSPIIRFNQAAIRQKRRQERQIILLFALALAFLAAGTVYAVLSIEGIIISKGGF